jgi:hypothetical protein
MHTSKGAMRRRKLIGAVGLAVLIAVGAFVAWPRPQRITREKFDRIQDGMSRAEVEAILGPPGDYTTGPLEMRDRLGSVVRFDALGGAIPATGGGVFARWAEDSAYAYVIFDAAGRVIARDFGPVRRAEQGPLDSLLWRAKRLWRRWFRE